MSPSWAQEASNIGAKATGQEIWLAVTHARRQGIDSLTFNPEINSIMPDTESGELFVEIKTLRSGRKIRARLSDAAKKMGRVSAAERAVALDLSQAIVNKEPAIETVEGFVADGPLDEVLVVWGGSAGQSLVK